MLEPTCPASHFVAGSPPRKQAAWPPSVAGPLAASCAWPPRVLGHLLRLFALQINEVDHKLRISERATAAGTAFKESAVGRSTTAALTKVGSALGAGTKKVLEHEKVGPAPWEVPQGSWQLGRGVASTGVRG